MTTTELFFELTRVAIGRKALMAEVPTMTQWEDMYEIAMCQCLVGICFGGIQKLPEGQRPPSEILLQWMGSAFNIQSCNEVADRRCAEIWKSLHDNGLEAAIIKGQGIACQYGKLEKLRQNGDIDVWIKGGFEVVNDYVQRHHPTTDVTIRHFHYDVFDDIPVELHFRVAMFRNLIVDKKLSKWLRSFDKVDFVFLEDKGFCVPTAVFDRIFILLHIYHHFLFEGIGLRQLMDYYFVLSNSDRNNEELHLLKEFNMIRFAGATMWVLHHIFGLEEDKMICSMDEKEGRFMLLEILRGGNFGHSDDRYSHLSAMARLMKRGVHLFTHYPSEIAWAPVFLLYHQWWKWNKRRDILKNFDT